MTQIWPLDVWSPMVYQHYMKRKAEEILGPGMLNVLDSMTHNEAFLDPETMDRLEELQTREGYVWSYVNAKGISIQLKRSDVGDIRDNDFSTHGMRENYGSLCGDKTDNEVPRELQKEIGRKPDFRKHLQKVMELRGLMAYARVNNINWVDFVEDAYLLEDELSS